MKLTLQEWLDASPAERRRRQAIMRGLAGARARQLHAVEHVTVAYSVAYGVDLKEIVRDRLVSNLSPYLAERHELFAQRRALGSEIPPENQFQVSYDRDPGVLHELSAYILSEQQLLELIGQAFDHGANTR